MLTALATKVPASGLWLRPSAFSCYSKNTAASSSCSVHELACRGALGMSLSSGLCLRLPRPPARLQRRGLHPVLPSAPAHSGPCQGSWHRSGKTLEMCRNLTARRCSADRDGYAAYCTTGLVTLAQHCAVADEAVVGNAGRENVLDVGHRRLLQRRGRKTCPQ